MALAKVSNQLQCSICSIAAKPNELFACINPNCTEYGMSVCLECGIALHKRKDHDFDDNHTNHGMAFDLHETTDFSYLQAGAAVAIGVGGTSASAYTAYTASSSAAALSSGAVSASAIAVGGPMAGGVSMQLSQI